MKLNISIFVCSLKYLRSHVGIYLGSHLRADNRSRSVIAFVVSLSSWIYHELTLLKYTNIKLIKSFYDREFDITESIIHLAKNSHSTETIKVVDKWTNHIRIINDDSFILDKLLIASFDRDCIFEHDTYQKVELLLRYGANPNINDECCPLRSASFDGLTDVVKILLSYGIDKVYRNESLIYACTYNYIDIAKLLLEAGADNYYDSMINAVTTRNVKIVELLLEYKNDDLDYLARIAVTNKDTDMIKLLLEHGANVNIEVIKTIETIN